MRAVIEAAPALHQSAVPIIVKLLRRRSRFILPDRRRCLRRCRRQYHRQLAKRRQDRLDPRRRLRGRAFTDHWTARVEYLFVDLTNSTFTPVVGTNITTKFNANLIRLGVDYKF
jgi:hypothetical protein